MTAQSGKGELTDGIMDYYIGIDGLLWRDRKVVNDSKHLVSIFDIDLNI